MCPDSRGPITVSATADEPLTRLLANLSTA